MKAFCICCRDEDAVVSLYLDGAGETFKCTSCEEEFTREDVDAFVAGAARWAKLLKWVDAMPKADPADPVE